jgi:hypothetical protein
MLKADVQKGYQSDSKLLSLFLFVYNRCCLLRVLLVVNPACSLPHVPSVACAVLTEWQLIIAGIRREVG